MCCPSRQTKNHTTIALLEDTVSRRKKTLYYSKPSFEIAALLKWVIPKNIHTSTMDEFPRSIVAVYAGFQKLLIQNLGEFQNFARLWMVLLELDFVKINNI